MSEDITLAISTSSPQAAFAVNLFSAHRNYEISFKKILIETTTKYETPLTAYVIMLEHFHLVVTPSNAKTNSLLLQVLKQRFARVLKKRTGGLPCC